MNNASITPSSNIKATQVYVYGNTRNFNSRIDYIITNREIYPSQILDISTITSANVGTEHGSVLYKLKFRPNFRKKKQPTY